VWYLPLKISEISLWSTLHQRLTKAFRGRGQNLSKRVQNTAQFVIYHVYSLLWKGPYPLYNISKTGPLYFAIAIQKLYCWNQVDFFYLSGNLFLHGSNFYLVICVKSLYFNCSVSTHRCEALLDTFAHTFCFILKSIWLASELFECDSKAVHQLTINNAKLTATTSQRDSTASREKRGLMRLPRCSHAEIYIPALKYIQQKELASFYNTIELI